MAPLVIAGAAQLNLHWVNQGLPFNNVLGVSAPPGVVIDQTLAETVGAAIKTAYNSSTLNTHMGTSTGLQSVGLRDLRTAGQPEYLDSGTVQAGNGLTDTLPPQTALVVSVRTARAGASFRGRIYLGGFVEGDNGPTGLVLQAAADAAVGFIDGVGAALNASGMALAVLSYPREAKTIPEKIIPAKTGFVTPSTVVEVRNLLWDTQRRRATAAGGSTLLGRTLIRRRVGPG